jgi:hypothetical protein
MQERKKQIKSADNATYSIPEAGAIVDLSRNGAYEAARRGEIPVLRFGRKKVVPKALWDQKLGLAGGALGNAPDRNLAAPTPQRANEQQVIEVTAPANPKCGRGRLRKAEAPANAEA